MDIEIVAEGLCFPEGPVWMLDGSIILVETGAGRITRVLPDGTKQTVAECGGGPNGIAVGPDGWLYVANNGGMEVYEENGLTLTTGHPTPGYTHGWIDRIHPDTGEIQRLYEELDGRYLHAPNDIVFDYEGNIWFSDFGKHVGHTLLVGFDVTGPGQLEPQMGLVSGHVVAQFGPRQLLDSLAVDANGHVCVATVLNGAGIGSADPATGKVTNYPFPDMLTTNICFGGADMQDAWVTLSTTGRLAKVHWPTPGLKLAHYA